MGSSQSQEERTVTVESSADEGTPQFVVTESFVSYLKDKVTPEGRAEAEEEEEEEEGEESEDEEEEELYIPDTNAETITAPLRGDQRSPRSSARGSGPQESVGGDSFHWKEKFEMEKAKNEIMKNVTSREFDTIVGEVRDKLNKQVPQLVPACEEFKEKVADCYLNNPGQPLACRSEVKEYMACVHRMQRGEQPTTASSATTDTPQQHETATLPEAQQPS